MFGKLAKQDLYTLWFKAAKKTNMERNENANFLLVTARTFLFFMKMPYTSAFGSVFPWVGVYK
jgi:hypothetical protein